jgi:phospholipid/cholesterol/gamma-HCH transport system substrate-binding protein
MNDINHYGLLFQTDKRWQRVRARRANLLYTLQTPQEFKNYFNDEMDQITTSLSRVNVVLEETGELECFNEMVDNGQFKKALAELIRRVKMMEESIQMYNTQYSELETFKTEICEE